MLCLFRNQRQRDGNWEWWGHGGWARGRFGAQSLSAYLEWVHTMWSSLSMQASSSCCQMNLALPARYQPPESLEPVKWCYKMALTKRITWGMEMICCVQNTRHPCVLSQSVWKVHSALTCKGACRMPYFLGGSDGKTGRDWFSQKSTKD